MRAKIDELWFQTCVAVAFVYVCHAKSGPIPKSGPPGPFVAAKIGPAGPFRGSGLGFRV